MMGNAINCKTVPIAAHIAIVTIFLVLLFINTNPPKFRIPLQTNLLNFLDSLLVGARQSKKCPLFPQGKRGHLKNHRQIKYALSSLSRLYCRYRNFTDSATSKEVGRGLSPPVGNCTLPLKTNLLFIIHVPLYTKILD
ncbi:hypothetical protein RV03_GL000579 [Enterococcus gallinarum]|nr:hypothetical protein RV03_GL000579 [Enterococcus gallinarum]